VEGPSNAVEDDAEKDYGHVDKSDEVRAEVRCGVLGAVLRISRSFEVGDDIRETAQTRITKPIHTRSGRLRSSRRWRSKASMR
jgi:hypothetical protein